MPSIRKTKKRLKREIRDNKRLSADVDNSFHGNAILFAAEWSISCAEVRLDNINLVRKWCAFCNREKRKIRKQGRWKEYCEFKAYNKRLQASLLPPDLIY